MSRLHRLSRGIPRVINVLCDRAMLGAYVQGKEKIDRATLDQAAREVFPRSAAFAFTRRRSLPTSLAAGVMLLAGVALAVTALQQLQHDNQTASLKKPGRTASESKPAKPGADTQEALTWPADQAIAGSKATAIAALFRAWGADYKGVDTQAA